MNKKVVINFFQNLTLLTLVVTAMLLLTRFPMLDGALSGRVRELLSTPENAVESSFDLTTAITTVHYAVTHDSEYGRCTEINAAADGAEFSRLSPLLRAAIGSAMPGRAATHAELRIALAAPGIFVDLTTVLPMSVVAAWLGEEFSVEKNVRALALTTVRETAVLFLILDDGSLMRCDCALSSSAVQEITATFAPNAGQFAYETDYDTLMPYTILVQQVRDAVQMQASVPAGYSAYNLLTALDFNPHTNARYTESGGTEVVMQSPRVLRIGTDGFVQFSCDGEVTNGLYRIATAGESASAAEAVQGACALAAALSTGTSAASLSLDQVEQTQNGWLVTFCYRVDGVRVRLGNERTALRVSIDGDMIVSFEYFCRAYTQTKDNTVLLPPSMAMAIASTYEGAELTLAYVDNGAAVIGAHWFVQ